MRRRLSLFWFLYLAGMGIFFPFFTLYLNQDLGLSGTRVGLVAAVAPLVGLFAQPLWGQLADRTGSRRGVLVVVSAGVAGANLLLATAGSFATVLAATAILALFVTSVMPQATAVSLAAEAPRGAGGYGLIRMWGTVGFLVAVVSFPEILEAYRASRLAAVSPLPDLALMFPLTAFLSAAAAVVAWRLPRSPALAVAAKRGEARKLLRHVPVARLLMVIFMAQLCMQGPIHLFPLLVADRGGDAATVGRMWILMLALEIPLIAFSGVTLRRLGPRGLLLMGLAAESLRWAVSAASSDLLTMAVVQVLHGVGVAGVMVGGALYVELSAPEGLRSSAQAWISSVGYGAASALSVPLTGWLFDRAGASVPYALAAAGLAVLSLVLYRVLPEARRPD